MPGVLIQNIIRQLKDAQDGGLWLNESFRNKIDSLSEDEAMCRPVPLVHSVVELVSHIMVWRKECMHRLGGVKTDLMDSADNWKNNEELSKRGWAKLKNDLYKRQAKLLHLLANKDDTFLNEKYLNTDNNLHHLLEGIIHHDLYHLGQIGITIKLLQK